MGLLGSAECPTDVWVYLEMAQRAAAQGDIEEAERQEAFAYNVPPGSGQNYSETSLCSVDYAQTKQAIALARAGDSQEEVRVRCEGSPRASRRRAGRRDRRWHQAALEGRCRRRRGPLPGGHGGRSPREGAIVAWGSTGIGTRRGSTAWWGIGFGVWPATGVRTCLTRLRSGTCLNAASVLDAAIGSRHTARAKG